MSDENSNNNVFTGSVQVTPEQVAAAIAARVLEEQPWVWNTVLGEITTQIKVKLREREDQIRSEFESRAQDILHAQLLETTRIMEVVSQRYINTHRQRLVKEVSLREEQDKIPLEE